jgi:hypothetical protein
MNENSEHPERVPTIDIQRWLNDVVRRSLLQTGAMQAVEEKMKEVAERSAHMTESAESSDGERGAA